MKEGSKATTTKSLQKASTTQLAYSGYQRHPSISNPNHAKAESFESTLRYTKTSAEPSDTNKVRPHQKLARKAQNKEKARQGKLKLL